MPIDLKRNIEPNFTATAFANMQEALSSLPAPMPEAPQTLSSIRSRTLSDPYQPCWQCRQPGACGGDDSLVAAAEAGILDGDKYIEQLFASKEDVRSFRLILRDAGGEKWLTDRHFTALKKMGCAELDAVTYASSASFFDPAE